MSLTYTSGETRLITSPGDLVFVHRRRPISRLIAFGQRLRFRGASRPYAYWTHVAVIVGRCGQLVEALEHGVESGWLDKYQDVEFEYVQIRATAADRHQMRDFARACVGRPYGYAEIVSLILTLLTGAKIAFGNPGTLICSALAAQTLCRGDYVFDRDPNRIMPADLARELQVGLLEGAS